MLSSGLVSKYQLQGNVQSLSPESAKISAEDLLSLPALSVRSTISVYDTIPATAIASVTICQQLAIREQIPGQRITGDAQNKPPALTPAAGITPQAGDAAGGLPP